MRNPNPEANRWFTVNLDGADLADMGPGAHADWSPDDKQFAFAAGANKSIKAGIWVQNTNGLGRQWLAVGIAPHWSPDGSQIAHVAGTLKILDLADSSSSALFGKSEEIKTVRPGFAWSPDGTQLAVAVVRPGDKDAGNIELLIVSARGSAQGLRLRWQGAVNDVAWSPDGKTLAVSIRNEKLLAHRIHLLPAEGDSVPVEVPGQEGDNREVAFSPDGKLLAFASSRTAGGRAAVAAATLPSVLELVRSHDKGGTVYSLGLAPDGHTAFIGGDLNNRGLQVWDTASGDVLRKIPSRGIFVAVSPDGRRAASAEILGGDVQYLDLEDGSLIREFAHGAPVTSLQFSGDGSRLVTGGTDKNVCVFDVASGNEQSRIPHPDEVKQVALSPDGSVIAATCNDKKLYLWNAASGNLLRAIDHPAVPWAVGFSPDGRQVLTGTGGVIVGRRSDMNIQAEDDNTLRIWDVETGNLVAADERAHAHDRQRRLLARREKDRHRQLRPLAAAVGRRNGRGAEPGRRAGLGHQGRLFVRRTPGAGQRRRRENL